MEAELLEQGVELMLVGMGTVFAFLTCLVLATSAMSYMVERFAPPQPSQIDSISDDEVAAISAAIALHRNTQRTKRVPRES